MDKTTSGYAVILDSGTKLLHILSDRFRVPGSKYASHGAGARSPNYQLVKAGPGVDSSNKETPLQ